jgi:hypothetical protein
MDDLNGQITQLRAEREALVRALQSARYVLEQVPIHCAPHPMSFLRLLVEAVHVVDAALKEIGATP